MFRATGPVLALPVLCLMSPAFADDGVTTTAPALVDARTPSGFIEESKIKDAFLDGKDAADVIDAPGLVVERHSGVGQPAFARIRGGSPRQLSVSLDGYRISEPWGVGFDFGGLSLAGLDSVRVYRGAAATVFGAGALTGAIDLSSASVTGVSAGTFVGDWGALGMSVDGGIVIDDTRVSVSGNARRSDGDFDFEDAQGDLHTRVNNDSTRVGILASADHRSSLNRHEKFTVFWDGGERGAAGPSEFQQRLSHARVVDSRLVMTTRLERRDPFRIWGHGVDTSAQVGFQDRSTAYFNPTAILGGTPYSSDSDSWNGSFAGELAVYVDRWVIRSAAESSVSGFESNESAANSRIDVQRLQQRVAVSAEYAGDVWSLLAGGRLELVGDDREELQWLPSVGLTYSPWKFLQLRANGARTYRPPDFDELYLDIETVRGRPDLDSELAWTWDAGGEVRVGHVQFGAAYFENRMDSVILFLPVSSSVIEASNLDGALSRGVESWIYLGLGRLDVDAHYTWTVAHRWGSTAQLPHQPKQAGRVSARYALTSWLSASAGATGRSETNLDNFGNLRAPGWVSIDAGLRLAPASWATVSLSAQNLADDKGRIDVMQQPLPGRSIYASLRVQMDAATETK